MKTLKSMNTCKVNVSVRKPVNKLCLLSNIERTIREGRNAKKDALWETMISKTQHMNNKYV
jgi:hypothetical protein